MEPTSDGNLNIRFEDRDGFLYAFFSGKRNGLPDTKRFWRSAIDECNKRGYKKLLVEQYFPIPLSTIDAFYMAEALLQMPIAGLRIAFVDQDIEQNDVNMFAETVAVNRGGVGKVFTNMADAKAYLLSNLSVK